MIVLTWMLLILMSIPAAWADNNASTAGGDEAAELAKKLANPVASLISVPFQYNYDENFGLNDDGSMSKLNIQPVIPINIEERVDSQ